MIAENPDTILEIVQDYVDQKAQEEDISIEVKEGTYKAVITYNKQPTSEEVQVEPIITNFRITRVGTDDVFVVDFTKKSGDAIEFLSFYKDLETHIQRKFGYLDEQEPADDQE